MLNAVILRQHPSYRYINLLVRIFHSLSTLDHFLFIPCMYSFLLVNIVGENLMSGFSLNGAVLILYFVVLAVIQCGNLCSISLVALHNYYYTYIKLFAAGAPKFASIHCTVGIRVFVHVSHFASKPDVHCSDQTFPLHSFFIFI